MGPLALQLSERLRRILARERAGRPVRRVPIDPGWVRARVLAHLEAWEKEWNSAGRRLDPALIHVLWTERDRDVAFAEELGWEIEDSAASSPDPAEVRSLIDLGIAAQMMRPVQLQTSTRTIELRRMAVAAWEKVAYQTRTYEYAREVRAVRIVGDVVRAAPIGRVYAELTGRDALRWLLLVEMEQSTGMNDPWRVSREGAAAALAHPSEVLHDHVDLEVELPEVVRQHLEALGLLSTWGDESARVWGYEVSETAVEILKEALADSPEEPLRSLARTLVADRRCRSCRARQTPRADSTRARSRRLARLVRWPASCENALVPAQVAYNALKDAVRVHGPQEPLDQFGARVDRGFTRAFAYVENLLRIAESAAQPPASFRLIPAIRDAIAEVNGGAISLESTASDEATVVGHRDRIVLTLVNLLRNAREAGAALIRVHVREERSDVVIDVDDDGPGVPAEHHGDVFRAGFSLRPGGTGQGLALVREIVEEDHEGAIACTSSPLGGARFHDPSTQTGGTSMRPGPDPSPGSSTRSLIRARSTRSSIWS